MQQSMQETYPDRLLDIDVDFDILISDGTDQIGHRVTLAIVRCNIGNAASNCP